MEVYHWQSVVCFYYFQPIITVAGRPYLCDACKCITLTRGLKIDCSNRLSKTFNITSLPEETVWIDLSENNIKAIKWTFPKKIEYINLSKNNISALTGKPFIGLEFLRYLDLEQNNLSLSESIYYEDLFLPLRRLQTLNIKRNSKTNTSSNYIDRTFSKLVSLRTLKIDIPFNFTFGDGFKKLRKLHMLDASGITGICDIKRMSLNFFKNIPFLRDIDISDCKISYVDNGPFRLLQHLEKLDISHNKELGFVSLPNITFGLNRTSIRVFRADDIHCSLGIGTMMTISHIENLRQTKLVEASFAQNRMELIGKGVLPNMPLTLEKLSFAVNRLTTGIYLFEFSSLRKLKEYNMTLLLKPAKYIPGLFEKCYEKKDYTISAELIESQSQQYSKVQRNTRMPNITVIIPPSLETMYANSSKLYGRIPKLSINTSSLKNIFLQNNLFFSWDQPVFGFEMLEKIDLSNNFCSRISPRFTASGTGLKYFNIARNLLSLPIKRDRRCQLFKYQRQIEEFDLSNNRLVHIPVCTFQNMAKMKILRLNHNQLTDVNFRIRHMINLSYIDLSDNRLTGFTNKTMQAFTYIFSKSKVLINLQRNNLYCRCENMQFLTWLYNNRIHFVGFQKYTCTDGSNLFDFRKMYPSLQKLEIDCMNFDIWNVTATVVITLVISAILVRIIRKNIWHIRYFLHKSKRRNENFTSSTGVEELSNLLQEPDLLISTADKSLEENSYHGVQQGKCQYSYHVFISYVGENRGFVFQKMKPKLEANGLRLLIRDIHFEIGNSKIDNIMKAIGRSKRTICVVSKAYLKSKWRTYELNMAKMEGIKERGSLGYVYLILMPDLFEGGCDTAIKDFIDNKYFLDYPPDDSSLQQEFWQNLTRIINNPC